MIRTVLTLTTLTLAFGAPRAEARERVDAGLTDALSQIAASKLPCSQLRGTWRQTDTSGVTLEVKIRSGRVQVTRARLGMGEEVREARLSPRACRQLATTAVDGAVWTIEVPKVSSFARETMPRLMLGVEGRGHLTRYMPARTTPAMAPLMSLREQLRRIGLKTLSPERSAPALTESATTRP